MKLLIVEDEKKTGEYLTKGLTEAGFVVDLADNGLNGYHLAMTGDYDLIILDIMLPDVNGWDIVRMLRSANKGMPILLLTALGTIEHRVKGLELGADDYLVKPFAFAELLARVRTLLRRGAAVIIESQFQVADLMSKYRDYEQSRQSFGINVLGTLVVEVEAENGQTGFAVSTAGEMGCFIVEKHLNRFIEGKCVSDIKLIHDQMLNATLYYSGSGGLVMNTISCVDLALWDLFGKVVGLPVYKLLGGAVRDEIQFYATGARPDLAKEMGFIGGKMPTHWGPHDGDAGIRKDAAMVADMREKCGEDFWLMLDCWMSQDVNYATKLAHACAPYNLKWIEECLPPQQYEGYRELKRNAPVGMMVTSGEHHGTLQSFRTLSETGIDIMQPDVGWCGGLTTLVEIAAIAKSRGQLVVPHGSSVYSHHAVITFTNTPFSEFLMTSPDCSTMRPQFDPILLNEPVPVNGRIHKSVLDKPGFGVELNRDCNLKRPYSH